MDKAIAVLNQLFGEDPAGASLSNLPKSNDMHRVLLGLQPRGEPHPPIAPVEYYDDSLNDSQKSAVQFALGASEVACIWGPPGEYAS